VTRADSTLREHLKFAVKAWCGKALAPDRAFQCVNQTVVGERWVQFAIGFVLAMENGWV
jgi:hypothetical protein